MVLVLVLAARTQPRPRLFSAPGGVQAVFLGNGNLCTSEGRLSAGASAEESSHVHWCPSSFYVVQNGAYGYSAGARSRPQTSSRWTTWSKMLGRAVPGWCALGSTGLGDWYRDWKQDCSAQAREIAAARPRRRRPAYARREWRHQTDPPLPTTGSGGSVCWPQHFRREQGRRGQLCLNHVVQDGANGCNQE